MSLRVDSAWPAQVFADEDRPGPRHDVNVAEALSTGTTHSMTPVFHRTVANPTTRAMACGLALCAGSGCPQPTLDAITVSTEVAVDATAVQISWSAPTSNNALTELRLVRCPDDGPCPTTFEEAAAMDAEALQWRVRSQDATEAQIPSLVGPIRYPDEVEGIEVVLTFQGNVNEPVPAPLLVAGGTYSVLAFVDASTMVWALTSEGSTTFDVPRQE